VATARPLLTRDPITQRFICVACWNQNHESCTHPDCQCMHYEATSAYSRSRGIRLAGGEDFEEEDD
jgi:hypothetical protein